jgi:hypothetical protein
VGCCAHPWSIAGTRREGCAGAAGLFRPLLWLIGRKQRRPAGTGRGGTRRSGPRALTTTPSHTILVVSLGLVAWILDLKALSACWPTTVVRRNMAGGARKTLETPFHFAPYSAGRWARGAG